ncbi:MAG TPA: hypothetical protein VJ870_18525 [Amycolatopsis sp.]|nr:hypothetical protein [Amycolatopsis sp.]
MRSAHISRRQAEAHFDGLDDDYDAFAFQEHEGLRAERDEIERYVEDMERALAREEREALSRVPRFNDRSRVRRAHRRADRTTLRSLPVRLDVTDLLENEAA